MSSPFNLKASIQKAQLRLGHGPQRRKKRSDIGQFRINRRVLEQLRQLFACQEYLGMRSIRAELQQFCTEHALRCPSRATLYKVMQRDPGRAYERAELPTAVQAALYNLEPRGLVPGVQLVFYCFNYGELAAIHFAAGLPWLPLYQAFRMRGWRPRSHGLLHAVLKARGIPHG